MRDQEVLDPASEAEAEMAAVAHQCLVTALDHSKADQIEVILELPPDGDHRHETPVLKLPPRAAVLCRCVAPDGKARTDVAGPPKTRTHDAGSGQFLNVSRPFVIKEIEANRLKCRKVNRHRRIEFEELRRYQLEQQQKSEQALQALTKLSEDLGLEF
ncbi:helix-turn-helix domain-containing protein [Polaromonas sp. P1(28)-8]|nr:helix-turn-helix domain-containing protein [Polaromonas sp. P1(28)-8]